MGSCSAVLGVSWGAPACGAAGWDEVDSTARSAVVARSTRLGGPPTFGGVSPPGRKAADGGMAAASAFGRAADALAGSPGGRLFCSAGGSSGRGAGRVVGLARAVTTASRWDWRGSSCGATMRRTPDVVGSTEGVEDTVVASARTSRSEGLEDGRSGNSGFAGAGETSRDGSVLEASSIAAGGSATKTSSEAIRGGKPGKRSNRVTTAQWRNKESEKPLPGSPAVPEPSLCRRQSARAMAMGR